MLRKNVPSSVGVAAAESSTPRAVKSARKHKRGSNARHTLGVDVVGEARVRASIRNFHLQTWLKKLVINRHLAAAAAASSSGESADDRKISETTSTSVELNTPADVIVNGRFVEKRRASQMTAESRFVLVAHLLSAHRRLEVAPQHSPAAADRHDRFVTRQQSAPRARLRLFPHFHRHRRRLQAPTSLQHRRRHRRQAECPRTYTQPQAQAAPPIFPFVASK